MIENKCTSIAVKAKTIYVQNLFIIDKKRNQTDIELIGRLDDDSNLGTDIILWKHASEFYRKKTFEFRLSR